MKDQFYKERYLLSDPTKVIESVNLIDKDPLEPVPECGYRYIFIAEYGTKYTLQYHADSLYWVHSYRKARKAWKKDNMDKYLKHLEKMRNVEDHVVLEVDYP
ncbi:hypothetical protein SEA_WEASELS2_259 [Rhodococcus phage Weasels2]|uniref:Uncharacterized protein n=1 Tax=Rhodococcus phage Weasels2 TaxID=1897437 RepID=A0A1I9SAN1_9CAUD|nr:hypothetical protein FDH04_gp157 [Rhodococcus phage Weasels2]AOZ63837.1 hypothetical protein SEA_WEASELS2_259 [Rhodococcus phage Weasels2]